MVKNNVFFQFLILDRYVRSCRCRLSILYYTMSFLFKPTICSASQATDDLFSQQVFFISVADQNFFGGRVGWPGPPYIGKYLKFLGIFWKILLFPPTLLEKLCPPFLSESLHPPLIASVQYSQREYLCHTFIFCNINCLSNILINHKLSINQVAKDTAFTVVSRSQRLFTSTSKNELPPLRHSIFVTFELTQLRFKQRLYLKVGFFLTVGKGI